MKIDKKTKGKCEMEYENKKR